MYSRRTIEDFLAQKTIALVGVSRDGRGFGNAVRKELAAKGYRVIVVHPQATTIGGETCANSLNDVSGQADAAVLVTPPAETSKLVRQAAEAGIRRVWMQQGAESEDAIRFCEDNGIDAVHHQCILMFAQPKSVHRFHRGMRALFHRLPR